MKISQLSVFLENRPHSLLEPLQALAAAGIDLSGIALADSEQFGILRLVLRQAGMLVVVGLVVGVLVAVFAGQGMSALLFGVSRFDPVVFIGVVLLLAVVALIACLLPARRAVATDPMQALRYE